MGDEEPPRRRPVIKAFFSPPFLCQNVCLVARSFFIVLRSIHGNKANLRLESSWIWNRCLCGRSAAQTPEARKVGSLRCKTSTTTITDTTTNTTTNINTKRLNVPSFRQISLCLHRFSSLYLKIIEGCKKKYQTWASWFKASKTTLVILFSIQSGLFDNFIGSQCDCLKPLVP